MKIIQSYRIRGVLIGVLLGVGAPVGSLIIRLIKSHEFHWNAILDELFWHDSFYGYMAIATPIVFGSFGFVLGVLLDHLAEQKIALQHFNAILRRQSMTDFLTGLSNHRFLIEHAEKEIERARRYKRSLSCLMIDIDNFKQINDQYGHLVGDRVLTEIASAIQKSIRKIDTVGRYGGDEFLILLPESTTETALYVANKIQKTVCEQQFGRPENFITTSVSVGLANFECTDDLHAHQMIQKADDALLKAKRWGKNKICSEMTSNRQTERNEFSYEYKRDSS